MSKKLPVLLLLAIVLTQAGCQPAATEIKEKEPASHISNSSQKWEQLGFSGKNVSQIQVSSQGQLFCLVDSRLYVLEGNTWEAIGPDEEISTFILNETLTINIYAGSKKGEVFRINLQGEKWHKASLEPFAVDALAVDAQTGTVYAGQAPKEGGGLWKSGDSGNTWHKLAAITARCVVVHPHDSRIIYILDRATYLSADAGKSFEKINTPANYGVLIHPHYPDTAYIAYSNGVVNTSHKGEITSTNDFELPGTMTCLELNFHSQQEWVVSMWDYPSGVGGLYYSANRGIDWTRIKGITDEVRVLDMRFDQEGKKLYVCTAGKGLWVLNLDTVR